MDDFEKILDFQKILDEIAKKGDGSFHAKIENKYSPTELSGCIRNAYFNRIFPIPYDDKSYRNFLLGNVLHELFQNHLDFKLRDKILGKLFEDKVRYVENEKSYMYMIPLSKTNNERIIISGRLDTVIFLKDVQKPIVVDYKSTADIKYTQTEPKDAHVSQLNFYLGCTLADNGIVVYVDKRNLNVVQHSIKWSPSKFTEMEDFAINLDKHIREKKIPNTDIDKMSKEGYCSYCKYRKQCQDAENGRAIIKEDDKNV
jgi:CRISPR/Cas system-associated exonuclease Cas4 (RecB family)